MRILEIGSGAGDVALTLAELVGPRRTCYWCGCQCHNSGHRTANEQPRQACGTWNFIAGDARMLTFADPFDAIVGQFVLIVYGGSEGWHSQTLITHFKAGRYCRVSRARIHALSCGFTSRDAAHEPTDSMDFGRCLNIQAHILIWALGCIVLLLTQVCRHQ